MANGEQFQLPETIRGAVDQDLLRGLDLGDPNVQQAFQKTAERIGQSSEFTPRQVAERGFSNIQSPEEVFRAGQAFGGDTGQQAAETLFRNVRPAQEASSLQQRAIEQIFGEELLNLGAEGAARTALNIPSDSSADIQSLIQERTPSALQRVSDVAGQASPEVEQTRSDVIRLKSNALNRLDAVREGTIDPESQEGQRLVQQARQDLQRAQQRAEPLIAAGFTREELNLPESVDALLAGDEAGVTRTEAGFVPEGEAGTGSATAGRAREGEPTIVEKADDGTFRIVGTETGETKQEGIGSQAQALAIQQRRQGGAAPQVQAGQPTETGDRLLRPSEFKSLREAFNVGEENFDDFFRRDESGNIFFKRDAFDAVDEQTDFRPTAEAEEPEDAADVAETASSNFFDSFFQDQVSSGVESPDAFVNSIDALDRLFDVTESPRQKELQARRDELIGDVEEIGGELEGQGQRTLAIEEEFGVDESVERLQELNMMIAQRKSAYESGRADIMEQAIPQGLIRGQARSLQRQRAVEIGTLTSQAAALRDNIRLAQDIADRTVELEFQDERQRLETTKTLIDLNEDQLTKEEQKQATKISIILDERERALDSKMEEKKQIHDLMIAVTRAGGDPSVFDTDAPLQENLKRAKDFIGDIDPEETQIVRGAGGRTLLVNTQTGETIRDFGLAVADGGGGGGGGAGDVETADSESVASDTMENPIQLSTGKWVDLNDDNALRLVVSEAIKNGDDKATISSDLANIGVTTERINAALGDFQEEGFAASRERSAATGFFSNIPGSGFATDVARATQNFLSDPLGTINSFFE